MHEFMTIKRGALSVTNSYAPYLTFYANYYTGILPVEIFFFYVNVNNIFVTFQT
mgnify:CR=1 FL=1